MSLEQKFDDMKLYFVVREVVVRHAKSTEFCLPNDSKAKWLQWI